MQKLELFGLLVAPMAFLYRQPVLSVALGIEQVVATNHAPQGSLAPVHFPGDYSFVDVADVRGCQLAVLSSELSLHHQLAVNNAPHALAAECLWQHPVQRPLAMELSSPQHLSCAVRCRLHRLALGLAQPSTGLPTAACSARRLSRSGPPGPRLLALQLSQPGRNRVGSLC